MSAALVLTAERLESLGNDLFDANAFSDRGRFLDTIRRIRQLLGGLDIDPEKLKGVLDRLTGFLNNNPELVAIVRRLFGAMTIDQFRAAMGNFVLGGAPAAPAPSLAETTAPAAPVDAGSPFPVAAPSPSPIAFTSQVSILSVEFQSLADSDFHTAGILDNPGAWMALIQTVLALVKLFRGQ